MTLCPCCRLRHGFNTTHTQHQQAATAPYLAALPGSPPRPLPNQQHTSSTMAKETATLAIEYHGASQSQGLWRKNAELIDALAYIDPLTPDVKTQVDRLIEEEMRRSSLRPQDYLNKLPPLPAAKFEGHPLLAKEYERVRAQQPMPPLDTTRYRLEPPPQSKQGDYAAWASAVDNAHTQLEHQMNRITNLELLLRYGDNAWRARGQLDEALLKQMEASLQGLRKQIDQLNRERKLQQSSAGAELRVLEDQYYSALRKNLEISAACQAVEDDVTVLQEKLERVAPQQPAAAAADGQQEEGQQPQLNGVAAAAAAAAADGNGMQE